MKLQVPGMATPQQKIIGVNEALGNPLANRQQGTTRSIYDTLQLQNLNQETVLTFFEGCNSRNFPFTNLSATGNRLGTQESMVVQRIYFAFYAISKRGQQFGGIDYCFPGIFPAIPLIGLLPAEINLQIAQEVVIKRLPLQDFLNFNNTSNGSQAAVGFVLELQNYIVIPPNVEFKMELRIPQSAGFPFGELPEDTELVLRCDLNGLGTLLSMKTPL